MSALIAGRGLNQSQASTFDRCHSAVRSDLEKLKGGFGLTHRKSLQRSSNISVSTLHFHARRLGRGRGYKNLSRKAPCHRSHSHPEIFSPWGSFGFKGRPNQRAKSAY